MGLFADEVTVPEAGFGKSTYIGGLTKNMHEKKRKARVTKANAKVLQGAIRANVEPGTRTNFESLAKGLFGVSKEAFDAAERRHREERSGSAKRRS